MPTCKMAKDQRAYITQANFPPCQPTVKQPAGRLPTHLDTIKKAKVLALPNGQALPQPQTAEQLSGWEGGDQGRAAKETTKRMKSKYNRKPSTCMIIFTQKAFERPAFDKV